MADGKFPSGFGGVTSEEGLDQPAVPEALAGGPSQELVQAMLGKLADFDAKLRELSTARLDARKSVQAIVSGMELLSTAIQTLLPIAAQIAAAQIAKRVGTSEEPDTSAPAEGAPVTEGEVPA